MTSTCKLRLASKHKESSRLVGGTVKEGPTGAGEGLSEGVIIRWRTKGCKCAKTVACLGHIP
jgi:hypothetical protein